ncbi:MAG: hypothetical protein RIK87_01685 [Fuerstiella sp.]
MVVVRVLMLLLRLAIPIAIVYGLWLLLRPKWTFSIVVDETGVRTHDGISTPRQRRLLELFQKTRFVEGRVTVRGRYDASGRLQLKFDGPLSDEARQQVSNFLANNL